MSLFKNEVEELKKEETGNQNIITEKSKKCSHKVAEKEGIIESLGLAMSRHAEEFKSLSSACVVLLANSLLLMHTILMAQRNILMIPTRAVSS